MRGIHNAREVAGNLIVTGIYIVTVPLANNLSDFQVKEEDARRLESIIENVQATNVA